MKQKLSQQLLSLLTEPHAMIHVSAPSNKQGHDFNNSHETHDHNEHEASIPVKSTENF